MEYTDEYSGMRLPCPKCQQAIVFPGVAPRKLTSSLRLAGAVAKPPAGFQFSIAGIIAFLREFKHWKIVGVCLIPFVLVAGALVAASVAGRHSESLAPPPAPAPAAVAVDANALDKLTDLTLADQLVKDRLAAVNLASAASEAAEKYETALRNQRRGGASPGALKAADQALNRAHQACANARKDFNLAFAHYKKLGGTIDYERQLP
jgi:hypothetical protein